MNARIPAPPASPIISDTGFLLSVAATQLLLPILEQRWRGRARWPRVVHSELAFRVRRPGNGVSADLARRALACGLKLAGQPLDLTDDQRERAELLAVAIGGTDTRQHAGEAAGAVLASDLGGILACEDLAAAAVIQAREGVACITIAGLLRGLHEHGAINQTELGRIIDDLRRHHRPNVDGTEVRGIAEDRPS